MKKFNQPYKIALLVWAPIIVLAVMYGALWVVFDIQANHDLSSLMAKENRCQQQSSKAEASYEAKQAAENQKMGNPPGFGIQYPGIYPPPDSCQILASPSVSAGTLGFPICTTDSGTCNISE